MNPNHLANAIQGLGANQFPDLLLRAVMGLFPVDHLALMHLGADDSVHHVGSCNRKGFTLDQVGQRLYFAMYYHHDPNRRWIDRL
ncbi:MAG: hypothetical protein AAF438_23570, partial [Pseudomonadota bacterium]